MADVKISGLPAATTPLAGTELVPIVQSGVTSQVSVSNMTAGRTVAASTLNVDANTSSPAVRITQTGSGNALLVEDSASTDSTPFVIDGTGNIGIGGASSASQRMRITGTVTGATNSANIVIASTSQSDVTGTSSGVLTAIATQATSFTLTTLQHFAATQGTFGATSTVTNQFGFFASSNLTGATNNFGFYSNISSAANRWNFYANGTAANAFNGLSRFGAVTAPVNTVDITGSLGRGAPVTKTGNFSLAATENWVICNGTGSITATLPAASSWTGREFTIKTVAAQTVVSASSNVVPVDGTVAGTAILAATAGAWATLVSDGTNWVIMQAGA